LWGVILNGLLIYGALACIAMLWKDRREPQQPGASAVLTPEHLYKLNSVELRRLEARLQNVASNQSGDMAVIARVSADFLMGEEQLLSNFYAVAQPLQNRRLLDMAHVTDQVELEKRIALSRQLDSTSRKLADFCQKWDEGYRQALADAPLSTDAVQRALKALPASGSASSQFASRIYLANCKIAEKEISALSLLKTNWEKWAYNGDSGKIQFENETLRREYNRLVKEINEAEHERKELQTALSSQRTD
jgi:hypothetical protein